MMPQNLNCSSSVFEASLVSDQAYTPCQNIKRQSRLPFLLLLLFLSIVFLSSVLTAKHFRGEFYLSQQRTNSLIEEIGGLNEDNFMLGQQIMSQEVVLQSIADDFYSLKRGLSQLDGGGALFDEVFGELGEPLQAAPSFLMNPSVELSSQDDGHSSFLLMGSNGSHTDTIIVATVNELEEKVTLFSIPRDLYYEGRRINQYYSYYGPEQMMKVVSAVTGLTIDAYAQVDFNGFVEVVDLLGGVEISVDEDIYDYHYPDGRGGYDPYLIDAGEYHMDGEAALKYARSRYTTSDFDRAQRQQELFSALRVQADSFNLLDVTQLASLLQTLMQYTNTDINLLEMVGYYYDYKSYSIEMGLVLSTSNYLTHVTGIDGAYLLLPTGGSYSEIHAVVAELVN